MEAHWIEAIDADRVADAIARLRTRRGFRQSSWLHISSILTSLSVSHW
jgi:hypothetical protein